MFYISTNKLLYQQFLAARISGTVVDAKALINIYVSVNAFDRYPYTTVSVADWSIHHCLCT